MSITEAEKKIKAYADAQKTGSFSCVTPAESDRILRELYGLPQGQEETVGRPASPGCGGNMLNLADFL